MNGLVRQNPCSTSHELSPRCCLLPDHLDPHQTSPCILFQSPGSAWGGIPLHPPGSFKCCMTGLWDPKKHFCRNNLNPRPVGLGITWLLVCSFSSITDVIMAWNPYFWFYQHPIQIRVNKNSVHLPRLFKSSSISVLFLIQLLMTGT